MTMPKKPLPVKVVLDIEGGTCKVFKGEEEVATADFCFDDTQIRVSSVDTIEKYQRKGYGRLLFAALFLLSAHKKKPLLLWALDDAIPFYEKIGMLHLDNPDVQKRIKFGNVKRKDLPDKVDNDDFVWIPQHLKSKPTIYL
jgi:GNAT superfamily N-acetyltransferase